jgi:hypothetical protein
MPVPVRRLWATALLATLVLAPSTLAVANLRRAIYRDLGASGGLQPVPGLLLNGERLTFTFDGVFQRPEREGWNATHLCRVEAIYTFRAEVEHPAVFEFIAPSAQAALAQINDVASPIQVAPFTGPQPPPEGPTRDEPPAPRFKLTFQGAVRAGANEVVVTYLQSLSSQESGVRYFHRPRWRTFLGYEFWPIKEWARDPAFRAELTFSIPRRRGFRPWLFGQPFALALEGRALKGGARVDLPFTLEQTHDRLVAHATLSGEALPDLLAISAAEKE